MNAMDVTRKSFHIVYTYVFLLLLATIIKCWVFFYCDHIHFETKIAFSTNFQKYSHVFVVAVVASLLHVVYILHWISNIQKQIQQNRYEYQHENKKNKKQNHTTRSYTYIKLKLPTVPFSWILSQQKQNK